MSPETLADRIYKAVVKRRRQLIAGAANRISATALRELETPFLLLRGARSSPAFETPLRGLARALPRARIQVLESAGHQITGAGWREAADAVAGFLEA